MSNVLAIPDCHAPFMHKDSVKFLKWVYDEFDLDTVVHLGDIIDWHAMAQFDADPDGYSPKDELSKAVDQLQELYELFPVVKGCYGNHDIRAYRKAFGAGIPRGLLKDFNEIIQAPDGWEWRDEWEIDGVNYNHGNGYTGMYATRTMLLSKMKSVVHGHTHGHAGTIHISTDHNKSVQGMNAGCLVDHTAYALAYAKFARVKSSLGAGVVHNGIMTWVPMVVNKKNRWVGEDQYG